MPIFDNELVSNTPTRGAEPVRPNLESPPMQEVNISLDPVDPNNISRKGYSIDDISALAGESSKPPTFNSPMEMVEKSELFANKRYPVYQRGVDLENIYGLNQGWAAQLGNSVIKMAGTAVGTFAQSFATIPNTINAIREKSWKELAGPPNGYEADIDNFIRNWEDNFPNYMTRYEREHPYLAMIPGFAGSANFWGNGLIKNLGFTVGAIGGAVAQDLIIGAATEGLGEIPLVAAQVGKASLWLNKIFSGTNDLEKVLNIASTAGVAEKGILSMEGLAQVAAATKISNGLRYGLNIFGSSRTEGGIEARDGYRIIRDELVKEYKDNHPGEEVPIEIMHEFENYATNGMNVRFGINMALLTVSNGVQFGNFLKSFTSASQKGVTGGVMKELQEAGSIGLEKGSLDVFEKKTAESLGGKIWDRVSPSLANIFTEGVYEEGGQYAAERGTYEYYTRKYKNLNNPKNKENWDTLNEIVNSTVSGLAQQFGTYEGFENMFLGGLTAIVTGGVMSRIDVMKGRGRDARLQSSINILNRNGMTGILQNTYSDTLNATGIAKEMQEAIDSKDIFKYKNLRNDMFFNFVASRIPSDMHDVTIEQLKMLKDISKEEFEKMFGMDFNVSNKKTVGEYVDALVDSANQIKDTTDVLDKTFKNPFRQIVNPKTEEDVREIFNYDTFNDWKTDVAYYSTIAPDLNNRMNSIEQTVLKINPLLNNNLLAKLTNVESLKELANNYSEEADMLGKTIMETMPLEDKKRIKENIKTLRTNSERINLSLNNKEVPLKTFNNILNFELNNRDNTKDPQISNERSVDLFDYGNDINRARELKIRTAKILEGLVSKEGFEKYFKQAEDIANETIPETETETKPSSPVAVAPTFKNKDKADEAIQEGREYEGKTINTAIVKKIGDNSYQVIMPDGKIHEGKTYTRKEAFAIAEEVNKDLSPLTKVKVRSINSDGTISVEDLSGNIQRISPQQLNNYSRIETPEEKIIKEKGKLDKEQTETELDSGDVGTIPPTESQEGVEEEDKKRGWYELFAGGTTESEDWSDTTQSAPHVKRSRVFLNNAKNFKDNKGNSIRRRIKAILITPNDQERAGLTGLTELAYGTYDSSKANDVYEGLIAQVFVEQDVKGKLYFIDEEGNRIGEVYKQADLSKVIFQVMPTPKLTNSKDKPRYRENEKEQALAASKAWEVMRGELFASNPIKPYDFSISRGIPIIHDKINGQYEKNHVGGILIDEKKIASQQGFVEVSTKGAIVHQGQNIKITSGLTVFKRDDILGFLNNNKFNKDRAFSIYQVIKAMAKEIEESKTLNRDFRTYLQHVLFWKTHPTETSKNQIFVDTSTGEISLGGNRYKVSEIPLKEEEIVNFLMSDKVFHNINNFTLSDDVKFHAPFIEYKAEKDGTLNTIEWDNYQQYLLANSHPDGSPRSVEETPLTTNIAKPDVLTPYSFKQKYATLIDFELPLQAPPTKTETTPSPTSPIIPEIPTIKGYKMDGETVHSYKEFKNEGKVIPVDFTGRVENGTVKIKVTSNDTTKNYAENRKAYIQDSIVPLLEKFSGEKISDKEGDETLVMRFLAYKIVQDLQKAYSPVQEVPKEVPTPIVVKEEAKLIETNEQKLFNPNDKVLKKGSVVEYKGETYLFWNQTLLGKAQLIKTDGTKFSGTPNIEKLNILGSYITSIYNGTEYIVTDKDNVYSSATGKLVYTGEDNSSKTQKQAIIDSAKASLTPPPIKTTKTPGQKPYSRAGIGDEGKARLTDGEIQAFKQWAEEAIPNFPHQVLDNIIRINSTERAFGVFEDGTIKFYKGAIRGTPYHEAFEAIWNSLLSPEEQQVILDEQRTRRGEFLDRQSNKNLRWDDPNTTDPQIKERIADEFGEYKLGKLPARTLGEKIIKFFRHIIEFFKSFGSRPSLKTELFKAIDSGKFKEAIIPEGVKREAPEYSRVPGLTEKEAQEYVMDMHIRASQFIFGEDNSMLFDVQKLTSNELFGKIKQLYIDEDKYGEGTKIDEEVWKLLVKRTKNSLRTLGIKYNEEEPNINDEERDNRNYAPETFSTDLKKASPFDIKIDLSTNVERVPTNQQNRTSIELPDAKFSSVNGYTSVGFSKMFATLLGKFSNTTNIERIEEKFAELAKMDANYVAAFQRFGANLETGVFDFQNFDYNDWRHFISFYQTFTRQKPKSVVQYSDGGQVYTGTADVFSAVEELQRAWFQNIKVLSQDPRSPIRVNRSTKTYQVDKTNFPKAVPRKIEDVTHFLASLGIEFNREMFAKLKTEKKGVERKSQQEKFLEAVNGIYTYLQGTSNLVSLSGKTLDIGGHLNTISELIVRVTNPSMENTHMNLENNRIQNYADNNVPSIFENEFNDSSTIDAFKQLRRELNDVFSRHSVTLMKGGLFFNKEGIKIRGIKVGNIEGEKNKDTDRGTTIVKLSKGDRIVMEINQNIKGDYYILIPGDGNTEWMMDLGNYITLDDVLSGKRGWNKIFNVFRGYLEDDVALALDWKNREILKNIGDRARELRFFKDILSEKALKNINQFIATDTSIEDINKYITENIDDINTSVKEFITGTIDRTRNELVNNGRIVTIKSEEGDKYAFRGLDDTSLGMDGDNLTEDELNSLLTFTNTNLIINNIEFHKIIFGDPYQFAIKNGQLEETKRVKSTLSPARLTFDTPAYNTFLNQEYNIVDGITLDSKELGNHLFKSYTKTVTIFDVFPHSGIYSKVNEADSGSLIIDNTYREVKLKNRQWTKEAEDWHQWQMSFTRQNIPGYIYQNEKLKEHDVQLLKSPEPIHTIDVLKPIVRGVKSDSITINLVIDKFSQMPLYYKATLIDGKRTNLSALYEKMWKEEIGYVVMESGRKVGITERNNFYNGDGTFNNEPFTGTIDVPWKAYGIQLETSYDYAKEQTRGSQLTKLSSLDLYRHGEAITPEAEKQYNRNVQALRMFHENKYNRLLTKLGVEDLGTEYKLTNPEAVQNTLEHEMLRRSLNENATDTIQLDKNNQFPIPFEASTEYQRIKDILYSMINNSLVSPKMNGTSKVMAPITLWENEKEGRGLILKTEDGYKKITREEYEVLPEEEKKKVMFSSDTLHFYTKEHPYCEVMLPHWFREKLNIKKFPNDEAILKFLNSKEGQEILTGIGFRIPTQAMSSIEVFKVKGFLPAFMGDTIVVTSEITTKTNADFDIDKLNTYLKSIYIDENDDIRLVRWKGSEESTKQFFSDVYTNTISRDIQKITKHNEFRDTLLNIFSKMETLPETKDNLIREDYTLTTEENEFYDNYKRLINEIISQADEENMIPSEYMEDQINKSNNKEFESVIKLLDSTLRDEYVNNMYTRSLENEYYDSLEKMLTLPENYERLIHPVDDANLKNVAKHLDELRGEDETKIKNRLLDRTYMTSLRHDFLSAKSWVRIAATNITDHSNMQKAKVYINPERFNKLSNFEQGILGDGEIYLPHNTTEVDGMPYTAISGTHTADGKEYISDRLSGYATSFVDAANNPYITKIVSSDNAVSTLLFLERMGAGETAIMFMNQPIVREYINYLDSINSRRIFGKKNIEYIIDKFATNVPLTTPTESYTIEQLEKNIEDFYKGKLSDEQKAEQQSIFYEFLKYSMMARKLFNVSQATNYDTAKSRSGATFSKKRALTQKVIDTSIFSGVDNMLKNTFLWDQIGFLDDSISALGSIMKLESDDFSNIIDKVLSPYYEVFLNKDEFDRVANKAKASFIDYIVQTKSGLNSQINELLISPETSVATQLEEAKKRHPELPILQHLQAESSEKGTILDNTKTVKLDVNLKTAYDENLYIGMMRELKDIEPEFYNNLVNLSILQGTYQSAVSIKNIIPIEDYSNKITQIINSVRAEDVADFAKGWFNRNNFRDNTIAPAFVPRFFTNDEQGFKGVDQFGNDIYQWWSYAYIAPELQGLELKPSDRRILLVSETYDNESTKYDLLKVQRTIKYKGEWIDLTSGLTVTPFIMASRIKNGDTHLWDWFGYQKVKYSNDEPVVTAKGEHVYKLVNLYGDGQYGSEYYDTFKPSVMNNNTVKVDGEIPDGDIIRWFGKEIEENVVSLQENELTMNKEAEKIYNELGTKTISEHIKIVDKPYLYSNKQKKGNAVVAYKSTNMPESFENPFHVRTNKTTKENVISFIDFVLNSNEPQAQWIREKLQSGEFKGKPIYYGNTKANKANEPSHATALDYLINKYDWGKENNNMTLKDGKSYTSDKINSKMLEDMGYSPEEIGGILKQIC